MSITVYLPDGSKYNANAVANDDARGRTVERQPGVPVPDSGRAVPSVPLVVEPPAVGARVDPQSIRTSPSASGGGFSPTEGQQRAIECVRRLRDYPKASGCQIVGYAGTGKTTTIKELGREHRDPIVIAPTGKAALRVTEATGVRATTIHKWLYEYREGTAGQFSFVLKNPDRITRPACKLVIVDEASMIGQHVWRDLWTTVQRCNLRVVLVGDGFQLPPVENQQTGATGQFSTMTGTFAQQHSFARVELTEIVRQAAESPVVRAASRLRQFDPGGLRLLPEIKTHDLAAACRATLDSGGVIIAHTNVTRQKCNGAMRRPELSPGEPLLVLRNDYDLGVYNGQQVTFLGWEQPPRDAVVVSDKHKGKTAPVTYGLANVDVDGAPARVLLCPEQIAASVDLGEHPLSDAARPWARARRLLLPTGQSIPLLHCNYGYCYTAHKAQGSEWPFALVVLERTVRLSQEEGLRWAYTAITRAKHLAAVYHGTP